MERDRFGKLVGSAGQFFWEVDRDYRVVFANDLMKRVFGDPEGKLCHEFMAGSRDVCPECPVKRVFDGAERATHESRRCDKEGRAIWLQHTATPVKNEGGGVTGASELIIDTTQRKQTEEWLTDSERLYRNLVEQVPDVIFSLDQAGRFSFVNTQVERFLGYPVQDLLEKHLSDYVAPEDRDRVHTMRNLLPEAIWDEELAILDVRGERKFARIRCKASFGSFGNLLGFEGVMRDRTVRRKLEEDLKASKEALENSKEKLVEKIRIIDELYEHIVHTNKCRAIEEHTAEVAHELRQPLAIVGGFARRLAKQLDLGTPVDVERQKQYLDIIVNEIQRLERILDGLIEFTKRERVSLQRVSPNELIEYIIGVSRGRLNEKRLTLNINLGLEVGEIMLDPGRFQQLVLNLMFNAIDASPVGGVIELETGVSIPSDKALKAGDLASVGFFEMKVRNRGPAIDPEALQNLFSPFFTTKEHGTGLGLAVSKKIVEDHEGSISVKSDHDSTVFTVWLPLDHPNGSGPNRYPFVGDY